MGELIVHNPERHMRVAAGTALAVGAPYLAQQGPAIASALATRLRNYYGSRLGSYVRAAQNRASSFIRRQLSRVGSRVPRPPTSVVSDRTSGRYTRYMFPRKYGKFRSFYRRRRRHY